LCPDAQAYRLRALFVLGQPATPAAPHLVWRDAHKPIAELFDDASDFHEGIKFSEGLARAASVRSGESKGQYTEDYKYGFINQTGKFVIAPTFDAAGDFSEGLAPVLTATETGEYNGLNPVYTIKWGYLDKTGKMLIKQQFQKASSFHEGCAAVQIADREDNNWVFIDKTGSKLFTQTWDQLGDFSNGLAPVCLPVSQP
jgi:hypothetical protein